MRKSIVLTVSMLLGLALFSACASLRTWPDYERSAENKMVVIQENIGDGLKTGAFTPDAAQRFLTTLKGISTDYAQRKGKKVSQRDWDTIHTRLDVLEKDTDRASDRAARIAEPKNGNRIIETQRNIDDGIISGRVPLSKEKEFQSRLDSIRKEYLQMTAGGRAPTYQERTAVSLKLDSLTSDISSFH